MIWNYWRQFHWRRYLVFPMFSVPRVSRIRRPKCQSLMWQVTLTAGCSWQLHTPLHYSLEETARLSKVLPDVCIPHFDFMCLKWNENRQKRCNYWKWRFYLVLRSFASKMKYRFITEYYSSQEQSPTFTRYTALLIFYVTYKWQ